MTLLQNKQLKLKMLSIVLCEEAVIMFSPFPPVSSQHYRVASLVAFTTNRHM